MPASIWLPTMAAMLLTAPHVLGEVVATRDHSPAAAATIDWPRLRPQLETEANVVSLGWPAVFPVSKVRPILLSALAWSNVLLTLDQAAFSPSGATIQ